MSTSHITSAPSVFEVIYN